MRMITAGRSEILGSSFTKHGKRIKPLRCGCVRNWAVDVRDVDKGVRKQGEGRNAVRAGVLRQGQRTTRADASGRKCLRVDMSYRICSLDAQERCSVINPDTDTSMALVNNALHIPFHTHPDTCTRASDVPIRFREAEQV